MAFLVGMVLAGGYGSLHGDPQKLLTTWDKDGRGCGFSTPTKDYPYLYFPTIDYKAAQKAAQSSSSSSP